MTDQIEEHRAWMNEVLLERNIGTHAENVDDRLRLAQLPVKQEIAYRLIQVRQVDVPTAARLMGFTNPDFVVRAAKSHIKRKSWNGGNLTLSNVNWPPKKDEGDDEPKILTAGQAKQKTGVEARQIREKQAAKTKRKREQHTESEPAASSIEITQPEPLDDLRFTTAIAEANLGTTSIQTDDLPTAEELRDKGSIAALFGDLTAVEADLKHAVYQASMATQTLERLHGEVEMMRKRVLNRLLGKSEDTSAD